METVKTILPPPKSCYAMTQGVGYEVGVSFTSLSDNLKSQNRIFKIWKNFNTKKSPFSLFWDRMLLRY